LQVLVEDKICGEINYTEGKVDYEIECGKKEGKRVKVMETSQWLTLCEVKVFGFIPGEIPILAFCYALGPRLSFYFASSKSYKERCKFRYLL
jgi:hypothetical protein